MISIADVMSWTPCKSYKEPRLLHLWSGREALTAAQVSEFDIPVADRIWVLLRPQVLGTQFRACLADIVERTLPHAGTATAVVQRIVDLLRDPNSTQEQFVETQAWAREEEVAETFEAWSAAKVAGWAARAAAVAETWERATEACAVSEAVAWEFGTGESDLEWQLARCVHYATVEEARA